MEVSNDQEVCVMDALSGKVEFDDYMEVINSIWNWFKLKKW